MDIQILLKGNGISYVSLSLPRSLPPPLLLSTAKQSKVSTCGPLQPYISEKSLPVLIWIDDKPTNNATMVEYAKQLNVHVVQLNNIAEAKKFINTYSLLLEKHWQKIHFITNNVRSGSTILDLNAGEELTRFVRGRRMKSHILVYCGNLQFANYTSLYLNCKATTLASDCQKFIEELAQK